MSSNGALPQTRLRRLALVILAGVLIEVTSIVWIHPTAFLVFAGLGATTTGVGIVIYLWSLASPD